MQQKNKSSYDFSERTDRLAAALHVTMRELGPKIGVSPAMLFGYRSGKYDPTLKAWRKLEAAEQAAGIDEFEKDKGHMRKEADKVTAILLKEGPGEHAFSVSGESMEWASKRARQRYPHDTEAQQKYFEELVEAKHLAIRPVLKRLDELRRMIDELETEVKSLRNNEPK